MENDFLDQLFYQKNIAISFYEIKEIVGCPTCKGAGYTSHEELVDYHKREYDTLYNKCKKCEGEGRLTKTIVNASIQTRGSYGNGDYKKETYLPYSKDPIEKPYIYKSGKTKRFKLDE